MGHLISSLVVTLNMNGKGGDFPFIKKEKNLVDRSLEEVNQAGKE
jgi:hypothetical protein